TLRRVADFVDLPWDDAMLSYHHRAEERMREVVRELKPLGGGTINAEERVRQHELVSRPPSQSRAGRWRTEMSPEDRAAFESVAGQKREESGVKTSSPSTTAAPGEAPNSNLVSARTMPRASACAAACW